MAMPANLTPEQASLVCFAINRFGTGNHPEADIGGGLYKGTLGYFSSEYAAQCVQTAVASGKLSDGAKQLAADTLTALA
jgi:hypothetical protein